MNEENRILKYKCSMYGSCTNNHKSIEECTETKFIESKKGDQYCFNRGIHVRESYWGLRIYDKRI